MTIDPTQHPTLAPLPSPSDAQRAIAVMKRHGCYVVPLLRQGKYLCWQLRTRDGKDFDLEWTMEHSNLGDWPTPEAALLAAGEYLAGKDGGA